MRTICVLVAGVVLGVFFLGCASSRNTVSKGSGRDAESSTSLAGTRWQLVEIQSMSDEVGTVSPEDPSLYTMSLGTDGSVALELNCNRGSGTWAAAPSSEIGGSLSFSPLAVTRMFCPPPSLDERIARDFDYVRSYILENGRLYLSLMADGGIYVWAPLPDTVGDTAP